MTDNIFARLAKVSAEVGAVAKDGYNSGQKFSFRGIDHVVNACHGPLINNGVVVIPKANSVEYLKGTTAGGKGMTIVHLDVTYVFACGTGLEGEYVEVRILSEANDSADKATAKAWSVALRTALLQVLMLPTDDPDPDESYDETLSELEVALGELMELAKAKDMVSDVKELAQEQYKAEVKELSLEQVRELIKATESAP